MTEDIEDTSQFDKMNKENSPKKNLTDSEVKPELGKLEKKLSTIIDEKSPSKNKKKHPFYFDGKIDLATLLTIFALIIGFITLQSRIKSLKISEKALQVKVEDMSQIIDRLDNADLDRTNLKVDDLNAKTAALEGNNEIWDWIIQNNHDLQAIQNSNYFELSIAVQEIFEHVKSQNEITNLQLSIIDKFEQINIISLAINSISEKRHNDIEEYERLNKPKRLQDETTIDLNKRSINYVQKLSEYLEIVNGIYKNQMEELTIKKKNLYQELIELRQKDYKK